MSEQPIVRPVSPSDRKFSLPSRKPIIGVDLDNVCFPHTRELRPFAAEWIAANKRPAGTQAADLLDDLVEDAGWFAPEWHITPDEFFAIERYAIEHGFFRDASPISGAAETLRELDAAGYHIRYVTARPQFLDAAQQTRDALLAHGFPNPTEVLFVGDHFGSHLKSMLNYALYIDDSVSNIRDFQATGIPYIIFDQVYNQELGDEHRAVGWHQVRHLVHDILERIEIPVDRSRALYEAEEYCLTLNRRLEQLAGKITDLTAERTALLRKGKNSVAKAKKSEIDLLEGQIIDMHAKLDDAEGRRVSLLEDVRKYDEWAREHPEHVTGPSLRKLIQQQQELEARERALAERESVVIRRERLLGKLGLGLDVSVDVIETLDRDGEAGREIVSWASYTHELPEIPRLLDSLAMMVARAHVNRTTPYTVIDQRVVVRLDDETMTDIDLLAIRNDEAGVLLQNTRTELLAALELLNPHGPAHAAIEADLRRVERELFLAVEVKTGHRKLSTAQRRLHAALRDGETATITTKHVNPDAAVHGLAPGVSIAATEREIGVTGSELIVALQTNANLRRQLLDLRDARLGDGGLERTPEDKVIDLYLDAIETRSRAAEAAAGEFGPTFEPSQQPGGN